MCNSCIGCALNQWTNVPGTFLWHQCPLACKHFWPHFQLPWKGSYTAAVHWQCEGVCCLPSCAHEWVGRMLTGATQGNDRGWDYDWGDLVQLPRNIPNCCLLVCDLTSLFLCSIKKIIQAHVVQSPAQRRVTLDLEQWASSLLHPTTETLCGWRNLLGKFVPVLGHSLWTSLSK